MRRVRKRKECTKDKPDKRAEWHHVEEFTRIQMK